MARLNCVLVGFMLLICMPLSAATLRLSENFDDQSIDSHLTPRIYGAVASLGEYSWGDGRGGSGYSYGSGTINATFLEWGGAYGTRTALVTSSNLSSGTWYYIEAAWDVDANTREVWIDGVSVGTSSATINAGDATVLVIGNNPNVAAVLYIDNVAISDDITRDLEALKDLTASPR